ncbi:Lrp/AsnC family transcriptional regulator [Kineobactrum salinum]|uniref:Lrp/AsnC family transcriptional regulator n=1 Tax=Kineobactrum salinum TaxID=2708301 RepID=A0A6C0U514_9GAMM|nr:Lrp/AsnC family transcriptional regulator [Kineobactrum salinum]QIB67250.1 Lrp/AsnC family transcriptional regulator [Kineobactrum salinum]
MTETDTIDQELLRLLRHNARSPVSVLARRLGLSRSTVQDRIGRLERRGIIAGYTVRFGDGGSGGQLSAHVMIQINPKQGQQVAAALAAMPAVTTLQTVSGLYDLVTTVETPNTAAMDQVLDAIGAVAGVEKTTTSIVLTTKFER